MPSDKRIIVRIEISSNKRSTVVAVQTKLFDVLSSQRWEVLDPEMGILEIGDDFCWQIHLSQNVVLAHYRGMIFSFLLFFLFFLVIFVSLFCFLLLAFSLLLGLIFLLFLLFLTIFLLIAFDHSRLRRKLRRESICCQFIMQLFSCSRNWHA